MMIHNSIVAIILAGIMNGSFIIPSRYTRNLNSEQVWLIHSSVGLLIIPLVILFISPNILNAYLSETHSSILILLICGLLFGVGQILFSKSINLIGIGLSFAINLGLGVAIGSLYVVICHGLLFTKHGAMVSFSIILILLALYINYVSSKASNIETKSHEKKRYHLGWLFALLTGLTSGIQNIAFVIVAFNPNHHLVNLNPFWVWPLFLISASIPMMIGFSISIKMKNNYHTKKLSYDTKNLLLITMMGILFTGSLYFYSTGMQSLNAISRVIGWPSFMVAIILSSQVWGIIHKDKTIIKNRKNIFYKIISIGFLIASILILSFYH